MWVYSVICLSPELFRQALRTGSRADPGFESVPLAVPRILRVANRFGGIDLGSRLVDAWHEPRTGPLLP